jgi:hypothetical protein
VERSSGGVMAGGGPPTGKRYPSGYASPEGGASAGGAVGGLLLGLGPAGATARRLLPWAGAALAALVVAALLLSSGDGGDGAGGGGGALAVSRTTTATTAPTTSTTTAAPLNGPHQSDVRLELGPYFFNPSVVRHAKGVYLATARTAHMKRVDRTNWWFNEAYVCTSARADFAAVSCRKFDPWQGRFAECLWGSARKAADVDTKGLEDAKLFSWPGKGVYAVFGRKPEALGASPYCVDPVFVQFLVQVVADGKDAEAAAADPWSVRRPRELKAGPFARQLYGGKGAAAGQEPIKEKNWMPFVHQDRLFMTHSVHPHRVFEVNSSGVATAMHVTRNDPLFAPFAREDVHGGPPVVLVPGKWGKYNNARASGGGKAAAAAAAEDYYLGVFHFFRTSGEGSAKVKAYHHYAYKTEARAPFRVCAVSRELALVTRSRRRSADGGEGGAGGGEGWTHQRIWKDTSQTAYVAGLALVERGAGGGGGGGGAGQRGGRGSKEGRGAPPPPPVDVLLSYGSSDIDARLLTLPLSELDAMFEAPFDCSGAQVIETVTTEGLTAGG